MLNIKNLNDIKSGSLPKRTLRQFIKHASENINVPRYFQLPRAIFSNRFIKYAEKRVAEKRKRLTLRHYTGGPRRLHFRNYFPESIFRREIKFLSYRIPQVENRLINTAKLNGEFREQSLRRSTNGLGVARRVNPVSAI